MLLMGCHYLPRQALSLKNWAVHPSLSRTSLVSHQCTPLILVDHSARGVLFMSCDSRQQYQPYQVPDVQPYGSERLSVSYVFQDRTRQ